MKGPIEFEDIVSTETTETLRGQRLFEETDFQPLAVTEDDAPRLATEHDPIANLASPSLRRHWLLGGLSVFSGLLIWQGVDTVWTAWSAQEWLTLSWGLFTAVVASFGGKALIGEWRLLRRLKQRQSVREKAEQLLSKEGIGNGKQFCQQLADGKAQHRYRNEGYERWINALSSTHNDREVMTLFDSMVLAQLDHQAKNLIAKHARDTATMVALSPLAVADMLLVAWRTLTMINQLCALYGVELGYWSRIAILKSVLKTMAMAGASELAIDVGVDMLSLDIAGKVSARVAQGLGVGLLTARLGLRTMQLLRPLPYLSATPLRLKDVRKDLIDQLKQLSRPSAS